ncbi:nuclear transport factor 2 family protein [Legionella sp. D16C41]|uniref:nuclear transport factor 2 family protein n=1 Tax=Legionella sp. D16C41 TaxID=3402688 RepID=UPI003AF96616
MKIPRNKPAKNLFEQFCAGYEKRDLPSTLSLFTKNANVWGSGIDEYRVGLKEIEEQLQRDWSQSDESRIEIVRFIVSPDDALWAAAICNAHLKIAGQDYVFDHLRGTIIIEQDEGNWKIAHMHASFPDYRNAENNSFPVN